MPSLGSLPDTRRYIYAVTTNKLSGRWATKVVASTRIIEQLTTQTRDTPTGTAQCLWCALFEVAVRIALRIALQFAVQ